MEKWRGLFNFASTETDTRSVKRFGFLPDRLVGAGIRRNCVVGGASSTVFAFSGY